MEKTPVITAWLAMAAAKVASSTMGICAQCGITEKNAINLKNLHEASMADYAVAVHRIEKEGIRHAVRKIEGLEVVWRSPEFKVS